MDTGEINKKQLARKREDPDEKRLIKMLELYTMVPPSPYVLVKRKKKKKL